MKKKRIVAIQIAAAVIGVVIAVLVVLYAAGYYDFSFIKRPETDPAETTAPPSEEETVGPQNGPDETKKNTSETYSGFISSVGSYKDAVKDGKVVISNRDYAPGKDKLYIMDSGDGNLAKTKGERFGIAWGKTRTVETVITNEKTKETKTTEKTESGDLPLFIGYNGYIIYQGKHSEVYSSNGKLVADNIGNAVPAYFCDKSGRPLFIQNDAYYVLEKGKLEKVDPEGFEQSPDYSVVQKKAADSMPVLYSEQAEVLKVTNEDEVKYNSAERQRLRDKAYSESDIDILLPLIDPITEKTTEYRFGYRFSEEESTGAVYKRGYPFSSTGLAVVETGDGSYCAISADGKVVLDPSDNFDVRVDGAYDTLEEIWALPDTFGEESLGMTSFDKNGYLRVRRVVRYRYDKSRIVLEEQALVNMKGEYIQIPEKFSLRNYSCGVMMLERDGKFGFMTTAGNFIVDPECVSARPFIGGTAVVSYGEGRTGMVDTEGNTVIPPVFDYISDNCGGIVTAYRGGSGWTVFEVMGN